MKVKYLLIILNINYAYISYIIVYKIYVLNKFLYLSNSFPILALLFIF